MDSINSDIASCIFSTSDTAFLYNLARVDSGVLSDIFNCGHLIHYTMVVSVNHRHCNDGFSTLDSRITNEI